MAHHRMFHALPVWLMFGLMGMAGSTQALALSFDEALALAERNAPELAANAARIDSAYFSIEPADALPDPKLILGVSNYPISGPEAGSLTESAMTMQKIGIAQSIPNSAKREAREDIAEARLVGAQAQRQVVHLAVRQQAASAWLKRYYLERKLALLDDLDRENRLLEVTVNAQIASGRAPLADGLLAKQDAAQLADRRDALEAQRLAATAGLQRYVSEAAAETLEGEPPPFSLSPQALRERVKRHPQLLALSAQVRTAEARVHEAQSQERPDWGIELAYQHRPERYGDLISAQVSFDLPLFTASRQDPTIRARRKDVLSLEMERVALLREQRRELDSRLARYQALSSQLERAQTTWITLAQQNVDLQYAAYQNGQSDLNAILDARRELIDQRLRAIDLAYQRDLIAMQLHFAYGKPTYE